ncbi:PAS domain S-box protein [Sphingomonas sp. LB-2]|uniref:PAS domain S-box protein n=1 Tax=Sphingomonas caeni TaxID=2984949 RepID=UPI00222E62B8|nr:PAS domain S-box protein [Sphingomonas caeni]MCW3847438.1 PAS domain S-box protein [Sphingomonas caeni]
MCLLRTGTIVEALGLRDMPMTKRVATGFAALAGFASLLAFSGWVFHSPGLRGFGVESRPVWPLTALGYVALSLGFLAAIAGRYRAARLFWAAPLLLAVASFAETFFEVDFGFDRLLFPDAITQYSFPHPGRPGTTPITIFTLLVVAGFASTRAHRNRNEIAGLVSSLALGLAIGTTILLLFSAPDDPLSQAYAISIPSAITALALAMAYVFWHAGFGWVTMLSANRTDTRIMQLLLPTALLLPVLPSVLEVLIEPADLLSPLGSKVLVMFLNILLVALVAYWAVTRVGREQSALLQTLDDLRKSEERLNTATAAHELGVFEWDVASGAYTWSPGTEQRLGVKPGSMPDFDSWVALVEPGDVQPMLDTVARAVAERADRFSYRYRFREANGNVRSVEGSSRAFYDDAGNLVRTVGVILNVTERDQREAELRRREAQLRSIIETVPDAMVVIDEDGAILEFSTAAEELWGYSAPAVLGRYFTMLAPADERDRYAAALKYFLRTGDGGAALGQGVPAAGEAADGRRFPLEVRSGMAHVDGRTLLTVFFRDISERLASEERLSELSSDLAHVSRQSAMSEMAADLAHELNQPLSATSNFLAAAGMLLDRGEQNERVADLLRMGSEQTQRAGQIIRRLREFTERGEVEMQSESVEQTIRDAVELVLVGTGQFQIRVVYDLDPKAQQIYADRIQVQQVLVNLLRNATDALRALPREQRQITIASRKIDDQMVEIEVADTGPGIAEPVLKQLFSRFTNTKENSDGMGIGLSISKRIIEAHGGTMSAENRPEGGAAFRFTLSAVGEGVE